MKKVKVISIYGKRWFQKTYGNTYHIAKVYILTEDGQLDKFATPITYGYGSQYVETGKEAAKAHGYDVETAEVFYHEPTDVQRKKDLTF